MRLLVVTLAFLLLPGCLQLVEDDDGDDGSGDEVIRDGTPLTFDIAMAHRKYTPDEVPAKVGDMLVFTAQDTTHAAITTNGVYDVGDVAKGTHEEVLLNLAGEYTFQCHFHAGMTLHVTVSS